MRRLLFVFGFVFLAAPVVAQSADDAPENERPRWKLSGHYLINHMVVTEFDPAAHTFDVSGGALTRTSTAVAGRAHPGWGLSAAWSPDDRFWVEVGWQRTPQLNVTIATQTDLASYYLREGSQFTPFVFGDLQTNVHRFRADDVTLALLWDQNPDGKYFSLLCGGGIHRRYLSSETQITTVRWRRWLGESGGVPVRQEWGEPEEVLQNGSDTKTRLFWQMNLELYPLGKDNLVGVALSARLLSDGNREVQHFTDTPLEKNVMIGVEPGWYDVTARLVLRF